MSVDKAKKIARIAVENGWTGTIEMDGPTVTLKTIRNDEKIICLWIDQHLDQATYSLMIGKGRSWNLQCAKLVTEKLTGWPDLGNLFKWFPEANRPTLVNKYRRLSFDWENSSDDEIIANLVGRQVFWYSHSSVKMQCDVVLEPKSKKKSQIEIRPVGHRKLFNFIGAQFGFRSLFLDTIVKIG